MELGERIVTAMMMGDIDEDTGDKLLDVHLRVVREITCPISRAILDSRTAHLITVNAPDGSQAKLVVHPSVSTETVTSALIDGATVADRFDPSNSWAALGVHSRR